MKVSPRGTGAFLLLATALALVGCASRRASDIHEQIPTRAGERDYAYEVRATWSAGIVSAEEHAKSLRVLAGYNAKVGHCGDIELGPLPEGEYTGEEVWLELIETKCSTEDLPRELLEREDIWIFLTHLCDRRSQKHQQLRATDKDSERAKDQEGIPRACGLLSLAPKRPSE